jgi:ABC-type branched-subunit amino acid transport system ATPase component
MSGKELFDLSDSKRGQFIEVVGLPGSGKSTLIDGVVTGNVKIDNQRQLLEAAALHWLRQRSVWGRFFARPFLGKFAEQKYFSSELPARLYLYENPEVAQVLSEWFAGIKNDSGAQYIGRMIAVVRTIKNARLFDNFQTDQVTLFDEHWVQLLTVILNYGEDDLFLDWFRHMIELIPLPDGVIWLSDASKITKDRQRKRGKLAAIFVDSADITETAMEIERRTEKAVSLLSLNGVPILKLDAKVSSADNVAAVLEWLKRID